MRGKIRRLILHQIRTRQLQKYIKRLYIKVFGDVQSVDEEVIFGDNGLVARVGLFENVRHRHQDTLGPKFFN